MKKLSKNDWLDTALHLLAQNGPSGLTIHSLCTALKVTKGSFYHHFEQFSVLKTELLYHYENEGTSKTIMMLEELKSPVDKLQKLFGLVVQHSKNPDPLLEPVIRAWSYNDDEVKEVQMRIDLRRIKYVEGLCLEHLKSKKTARQAAQHLYSILVGCQHIQPQIIGTELKALFDACLKQYGIIK